MATRHAPQRLRRAVLLPEDIADRILDFDPADESSVWADTAGTVPAEVGDGVAAMDCLVSGMRITQATAGNRFALEAEGSYRRLGQPDATTRFLTATSLPAALVAKLKAPTTISWWVRPDAEPVAGNPNYQWEFYNTAEAGIHMNFQYQDPNDASGHKRFAYSRRRADTTGISSMFERVDDAIYPTADVGAWVMITIVNEGDPIDLRVRGYVNGVQYDILTGIAAFYAGLTTNAAFWLGCRNVTGNFANARFRRFTIWERSLSANEIYSMFRTTRDEWELS